MTKDPVQYCPECGYKMLLLFTHFVCEKCNPVETDPTEFDEQKTPTMWIDLGDFISDQDDDFGIPSSLPIVSCNSCGSPGYSGSICSGCSLWRP